MTTLLSDEQTTENLLAFLRSSDPVPRKPTRTATRPAATKPPAERRPLDPIQAATLRRPPRAAATYYASERAARARRDYGSACEAENHARRLNRVECRLVAWLVCRSLGDAWTFEPNHENGWHRLRHKATGAALSFGQSWRDKDRYQISADDRYNREELPAITVSAERTPADIAGDIERRLIAKGLFEHRAATMTATERYRNEQVERRQKLLAAARAYGGDLQPERRWHRQGYPEATEAGFGRRQTDDGYDGCETCISASYGYSGLEFNIATNNAQFAVALGEFIRRYYAE